MSAPVPLRPVRRAVDSLLNLVSSMGTWKDKSAHNEYSFVQLDPQQLNAAYRGDWVARKVVNLPANDSVRKWRAWQADKNTIELLEKEEQRLDVQRKLLRASICGRLYGGGLLVMGLGDDPSKELVPDRVQKGGLKYLQWLSRYDVGASQIVADVNSPYFGEPEYYEIRAADGSQVRVHASRTVRFVGNEIVDRLTVSDGWGDSVLQAVDDAVKNVGITCAGMATLVHESKIDVIKMPGLLEQVSTAEYRSTLMERFQLANVAKSTVNALLLDKEEEWQRINASFTGMPDVLKVYLLIASGAADIPATRMVGQAAVGLNATGEGDLKNYYDAVSAEQENELTPNLRRLDEILVRSATGARDEGIFYNWRPLWQMSEVEQADVWVKKATVAKTDSDMGTMDPDALAKARQNQLIEDGVYPGLDQVLEEYGTEAALPETNTNVQKQAALQKSTVADAGDLPGHEFRGNQYTGGSGHGDYSKGAASHEDGGYTVYIKPLLNKKDPFGPQGEIFIKDPSGEVVKSISTWQDYPETGWKYDGVNLRKDWDKNEAAGTPNKSYWRSKVPLKVRLGMEAKIQATGYKTNADYGTLAQQFAEYKEAESYARDRRTVADAAPRTLYVRRDLLNAADVIAWAKAQGLSDTEIVSDMHVTVAYSRTPVDWMKIREDYTNHDEDGELRVAPGGPRLVERLGPEKEAVCLLFASNRLSWRHCEIVDAGATWDYPEYQPHVTVSYATDVSRPDVSRIEPYRGELVFGPEIFEEVK